MVHAVDRHAVLWSGWLQRCGHMILVYQTNQQNKTYSYETLPYHNYISIFVSKPLQLGLITAVTSSVFIPTVLTVFRMTKWMEIILTEDYRQCRAASSTMADMKPLLNQRHNVIPFSTWQD